MKLLFSLLLFASLIFFQNCVPSETKSFPTKADSTITITLSVVGDIMCHTPQFEYARVSKDSFDFNPVFRYITKNLSESDFTFGNLETVTAGKEAKYSGYPMFNSPSALLDALKNSGFDLLITSNNHSLDRGESGIRKTINELKSRNINYTGTHLSQADRDSIRVFNIKNISIAFLAYSYGTNGNPIPTGKSYLINLIDLNLIKEDISRAKKLKPDLVLVYFHFGEEYRREPNAYQKKVVDSTINMGVDIIIGSHPHVLQPFQFIKSSQSILDSVFVAYSLGNFISNQRKRYTDAGGILTLSIGKDFRSSKLKISNIEFTPTWVFKGINDTKNEFIILPSIVSASDTTISFLNNNHRQKLKQAINDSKEILSKYNTPINFR